MGGEHFGGLLKLRRLVATFYVGFSYTDWYTLFEVVGLVFGFGRFVCRQWSVRREGKMADEEQGKACLKYVVDNG